MPDIFQLMQGDNFADRAWIPVRVSERTVCDPFLKHATVGYVVTWLRLVTT